MERVSDVGEFSGHPPLQRTKASIDRIVWRVALSNLPFLLAIVGLRGDLMHTLVVSSVLFFVPGLAWVDRRDRDAFTVLFRVVMTSVVAAGAIWVALVAVPGPTSRPAFLLGLMAVTNLGLVVGTRRGFYAADAWGSPVFRPLLLVALLFFVQSYTGAVHRIPALEDHDMEVQGTAYGLIHEFTPSMVLNRGGTYFFAHPLLLHFCVGASALIADDLDRLRYYHESALAVRDRSEPEIAARSRQDLTRFLADPVLVATRIPNMVLGVLVVFPLGFLLYRLTGSQVAAVGACVLYATLPEVYVRSAYGGYMAITNLLTLSAAYFYLQGGGFFAVREGAPDNVGSARACGAVAAFVGSWSNQKSILVAAAAALHAALRTLVDPPARLFQRVRTHPEFLTAFVIGSAFLIGWATYFAYGFTVAPEAFVRDHVRGHLVDRMRLINVNLMHDQQGAWVYPSILALWIQFAQHTGWIVMAVAAAACLRALGRLRGPEGLFLIWFGIGALGFSLVDWRQTKHLSKVLPPLIVLIALLWASLSGRARLALTFFLAGAMAWNVFRVARLMSDFTYIQPLPIW